MNNLEHVQSLLQKLAQQSTAKPAIYFKTGVGDYAEHDKFLGITVPTLRTLAREFKQLPLSDIKQLLASPFNEERLLALLILVDQYKKASPELKETLYQFYIEHITQVNNWNLVDSSAHLIVGAHLTSDISILHTLAASHNLWERRIAIVATWHFIRKNNLTPTFTLATILLQDAHDLMHKAVGWMLREAGKKDQQQLIAFLDLHAAHMPRTMLRYAIEKFSEQERKTYRNKT